MKVIMLLIFCLFCYAACIGQNQENIYSYLMIGDSAPPLKISKWIKGHPVKNLRKGKTYIVEFWATWCKPCIAAMPHLSIVAKKYNKDVIAIAIDIYEKQPVNFTKIKTLVDSIDTKLSFSIAIDDKPFMEKEWVEATGEGGIPKTFIVNDSGVVAWIGHPSKLNEILPQILNKQWSIARARQEYLDKFQMNSIRDFIAVIVRQKQGYYNNISVENESPKPMDSSMANQILQIVGEVLAKYPKYRFSDFINSYTFNALLATIPEKAYEYGKDVLANKCIYEDGMSYDAIVYPINDFVYTFKLPLPKQIYSLGADAYKIKINSIVYPEIIDMYKHYHKMAMLYWLAGDKANAILAQEKAIHDFKARKVKSQDELYNLSSQLRLFTTYKVEP